MTESPPPEDLRDLRHLIREAAAIANAEKPPIPIDDSNYLKCSSAIHYLAKADNGMPLRFPSHALPPLP